MSEAALRDDREPASLFSLDYLKDMGNALKRSKAGHLTLIWGEQYPMALDFEHPEWGFVGRYLIAPRAKSDGGEV